MQKSAPSPTAVDPARWVDDHGDYLFRYALLRVGKRNVAEDLVQETFLAGLRAADSFAGQSSERTWLTGILNNKWVDRLRRDSRLRSASELGSDEEIDGLFDHTGHWKKPPRDVGTDPCELLQRREFWDAFECCREGLPDRLREVLSLRLIDGVEPEVICGALGVTPVNLWTMLHRARVRLWQCLDRQGLSPKRQERGS